MQNPVLLYSTVPSMLGRHPQDDTDETVIAFEKALYPMPFKRVRVPSPCTLEALSLLLHTLKGADFIFNFCEEVNGFSVGEGWVAGLLDLLGIPFSGSRAETILLCRDKYRTHCVLKESNIPTPETQVIFSENDFPLFTPRTPVKILKPCCEDGSLGISKLSLCNTQEKLLQAFRELKKNIAPPYILQSYIEGREINVSILDGQVLPLSELDFSLMEAKHPKILTYEAKWDLASVAYRGSRVVCPAPVSQTLTEKIKDIALKTYHHFRIRHYGRVDFRIDILENPFVIDVNPNPCIAPDSGFMKALEAFGYNYKKIIEVVEKM
jgi:D-alanine-D-alanine ligase